MPDAAMNAWVKDALGLDPEALMRQSASAGQPGAAQAGAAASSSSGIGATILGGLKSVGDGIVAGASAVGEGVVAGAKAVGEGVAAGAKAIGDGIAAGAKAVGEVINDEAMRIADGDYDESMKRLDTEIKNVTDAGLDATPYAAQAKNIRDAHADALKQPDITSRYHAVSACSARAKEAADSAVADVANLKKSAVEGVTAAITAMRDSAKAQIDKIGKDEPEKADFTKRLAALDKSIEDAGKLTDRAERAKTLKDINKTAQKLFDDAVKLTKDSAAIEATYGKALKERYGIEISNPSGMPNTHLDQVYKMFDKVPEADVVQGQMKTLNYEPLSLEIDAQGKKKWVKNDGASFGGATINMGDYGNEDWPYVDPKDPTGNTPMAANGFSISTLHELGHSVDARFKIMDSNQGKSSAGGWRKENLQSTAKAFADQFKAGDGQKLSKPLADGVLSAAISDALGGKVKRPDDVPDPDWIILQTLLNLCVSRKANAPTWPWGNGQPHDINGRTYHEAYDNDWWSYETAVRAKALTVRDYQWRAPGEWFAELYAFSFYNEKPPPTGVDPALCAYMFGGSAAGEGAKAS